MTEAEWQHDEQHVQQHVQQHDDEEEWQEQAAQHILALLRRIRGLERHLDMVRDDRDRLERAERHRRARGGSMNSTHGGNSSHGRYTHPARRYFSTDTTPRRLPLGMHIRACNANEP